MSLHTLLNTSHCVTNIYTAKILTILYLKLIEINFEIRSNIAILPYYICYKLSYYNAADTSQLVVISSNNVAIKFSLRVVYL